MHFHALISFLRELDDNNSKAWMDEHRSRYESLRDDFIVWLNELDEQLRGIEGYTPTTGKDAIERINNNLLYHPEKPTYKSHFGGSLGESKNGPAFYVKLGLKHSMIAGGLRGPKSAVLSRVRKAIDERGDELKQLVEAAPFVEMFGEFGDRNALSTAPQGYAADHPYIELLRMKSFAVRKNITQEEYSSDGFVEEVVKTYKTMSPLLLWLKDAAA